MRTKYWNRALRTTLLSTIVLSGCSTERAFVNFSYVVEPARGLPPGMKKIYIAPAKIGPSTDEKWSDLCATTLTSLVNESRNYFGTDIEIADRRDTQVTFDEADLAASGMSDRSGGSGGRLMAADGAILSNVNVKVTVDHGRQRTLSGLTGWGGGGHGYGHGGGDIRTTEVETVTRHMTVQTSFKLVDTANNKVWEQYTPSAYSATARTGASPIFGSSKTEAALTPRDQIIAGLVKRGAREFISRLMPARISVNAEVISSRNSLCKEGVRLLRAELYDQAKRTFQRALADHPNDDRAAYGAGIACEASGQFDQAMRFYQQALLNDNDNRYVAARDRVKAYGGRVRSQKPKRSGSKRG